MRTLVYVFWTVAFAGAFFYQLANHEYIWAVIDGLIAIFIAWFLIYPSLQKKSSISHCEKE